MKFVNPVNSSGPNRIPYWDANRTAGLDGAIPPAKLVNDLQDEILKVIITGGGLTPDPNDPTQLYQALQIMLAAIVAGTVPTVTVPPGAIMPFAANTAPTGWLKANGQAVSRTTFATLFAAVGTVHGIGDGSTTFNVPDLRGEFLRGWDDARGIDAGRAFGGWQDYATARPKTTNASRISGDGTISGTLLNGLSPPVSGASNPSQIGFARASKTGEIVTPGDHDSGHAGIEMDTVNVVTGDAETRPRNVALLYIIKT